MWTRSPCVDLPLLALDLHDPAPGRHVIELVGRVVVRIDVAASGDLELAHELEVTSLGDLEHLPRLHEPPDGHRAVVLDDRRDVLDRPDVHVRNATSGLEHDLDRAVLLLLEHLVGGGRLGRAAAGGWSGRATPSGSASSVTSGMRSSTQRRTLAWPMRRVSCLSNICSIGSGSVMPPYTPADRERAAAPDDVDRRPAGRRAGRRRPSPSSCAATASGSSPTKACAALADPRAVGLHADGVDHRVGPPAAGALAEHARRGRRHVVQVDRLDAVAARPSPGARARGRRRTPAGAPVPGDAGAHLADRAEPEHGDRAAVGDVGVRRRPATRWAARRTGRGTARPAGPSGTLIGPYCACGHPQVLGLAAGDLAVELRVAEAARRRCPCSWTWVVSHCDWRSWVHIQQWPQEMLNGITTRSPTAMSVTSRARPPRRCPSARGRGCRPRR